jgi:hypothetical protein
VVTITTSTVTAWKRTTTTQRNSPLRIATKRPIQSNTYPRLKNTSDCIRLRVWASPWSVGREAILVAFKERLYTTKGTRRLSK